MSDGSVRPCPPCDMTFGNLHEKPFREIWNGSEIRAFRGQTFTCKGLVSSREYCNCSSCCHIYENFYVNRLFKWFHPFASIKMMRNDNIGYTRYSDKSFEKFCPDSLKLKYLVVENSNDVSYRDDVVNLIKNGIAIKKENSEILSNENTSDQSQLNKIYWTHGNLDSPEADKIIEMKKKFYQTHFSLNFESIENPLEPHMEKI